MKKWGTIGTMIAVTIGVLVFVNFVPVIFPLLISGFTTLSTLGNFTFASLFASSGLIAIVLSASVLIGALAFLGVKSGR